MAAEYLSKCTSHFITQSERCVPDFLTLIYPLAASNVATSGAPVKIKWNKTKFFQVKVRSGETRIVRSADRLTTFSAIWSEMFIKFWILTLLSALRADWISSLVTWRWFMAHTNRNLCNWFFFLKNWLHWTNDSRGLSCNYRFRNLSGNCFLPYRWL